MSNALASNRMGSAQEPTRNQSMWHPEVVALLAETRGRSGEHFGDAVVDLEILVDPEAPAAPELYALVQMRLGSADALRRLRRFDEEWWLDALDRTPTPIVVSMEHVRTDDRV